MTVQRTRLADTLTGIRFGKLLVIGLDPKHRHFVLCQCDCGNSKSVYSYNLKQGFTQSCGCIHKAITRQHSLTHGLSQSAEYHSWQGMKARCYNTSNAAYERYGGRGITVCDRWLESFENFYADMGPKPSADHSIERKNNNAGYSLDNCIWATLDTQANNTRRNRLLTMNGLTLNMAQWSRRIGVPHGTIKHRVYRGWSVERALTQPLRR